MSRLGYRFSMLIARTLGKKSPKCCGASTNQMAPKWRLVDPTHFRLSYLKNQFKPVLIVDILASVPDSAFTNDRGWTAQVDRPTGDRQLVSTGANFCTSELAKVSENPFQGVLRGP